MGDASEEAKRRWGRLNSQQEETTRARNELFAKLLEQNDVLLRRVHELDEELISRKLRNEQLAKMNKNLSNELKELRDGLGRPRNEDPLAVCLIDGDGAVFDEQLIVRGQEGGRDAAFQLRQGIMRLLNATNGQIPRIIKTMMFMNVAGLGNLLNRHDICTVKTFQQFVLGFNHASPLLSIVDVGYGKEAADAKLKENLFLFSRLSQTKTIFFAGAHDGGYVPTLKSVQNEGNLHKIKILEGYPAAYEAQKFFRDVNLEILTLPGLFRHERLVPPTSLNVREITSPSSSESPSNVVSPRRRLSISSQASQQPRATLSPAPGADPTPLLSFGSPSGLGMSHMSPGTKAEVVEVDLTKALTHQIPSLCNLHYLAAKGCWRGPECRFSHAYVLTPEQYEQYRIQVKKLPCPAATSNKTCTHGDSCFMSHKCPNGPDCPQLAFGKCRFKGDDMHEIGIDWL